MQCFQSKTRAIMLDGLTIVCAIDKTNKKFITLQYKHIQMSKYTSMFRSEFEELCSAVKYLEENRLNSPPASESINSNINST